MNEFHLYLYGPGCGPLSTTFDEIEQRLSQLPSLLFEPDGSFAWMRPSGGQIYGIVYDGASGQIQYCELRGSCSLQTWQELCAAIAGDIETQPLELLLLPGRELQDLQSFEQRWQQN